MVAIKIGCDIIFAKQSVKQSNNFKKSTMMVLGQMALV